MKVRVSRGTLLKYALTYSIALSLFYVGVRFLQSRAWFLGVFFICSAGILIYLYTFHKKVPAKYLVPGVLFLVLFQIYPSFYSGYVAFTNDSNGHEISKTQAISTIIENSKVPITNAGPVTFRAAIENSSKKLFLIFEYPKDSWWVGNSSTLNQLHVSQFVISPGGSIERVRGFRLLNSNETETLSGDLGNIQVNLKSGLVLQPQDLQTLQVSKPSLVYFPAKDELVNVESGVRYHPNNNGQMVSQAGEALYPGWKTTVGWRNFTSIIHNADIRHPLLKVLAWTFLNAIILIALSFLMGLCLALIFNSPLLYSRRIYRTIFIVPMAIPSVLSVLVWSGLFTAQTGVIDRIFHISTPWLTDSLWARIAVLIVELWVTFPYMFLICTGAIQAIPNEIIEAAEIEGASPLKVFGLIKLPLVMRTVAPLLVASGAMALNNFGVIYLLTGGGPTFPNTNGNAGATDILISYTYKLAFNSQEGSNYGLASALSILNFILIGILSVYGLRRMKTMEGVN